MPRARRPDLATLPGGREFTFRDGERTIVLRDNAFDDAAELIAGAGFERFELLTTPRALANTPLELAKRASAVHEVQRGPVNETAAALIDSIKRDDLVALGGGRVIDTAKAIAAVRGGRVAAIPTTLSGAEITTIHRLPEGHSANRLVRPALAICDPGLMTGLDEGPLRASAMNALAHGADSLYTPLANPVSTMTALRGAELIATALDENPKKRDVATLVGGAVLSAWALDSALFSLHHVVCQTLVRVLGTPHAETNAAMLPHTMAALRDRAPKPIAALANALGSATSDLEDRLTELGGGERRLSGLGASERDIRKALDGILARGELGMTPDPPDRDELDRMIRNAW